MNYVTKLLDVQHIWLCADVGIFVKKVFPIMFHVIFLYKMKVFLYF